ncbi:FCD domain-containing protein [Roseinatronobacter alkalisoli]|uniref:Pyruvate dehydrogenase complex repressor n=1 Tax=Roseinatronobacter alkalisoli TaxID=3028235 RepID=A0ABT5T7Z2_9RHOB|nr:FCD domain-containing protein [Roseinatronobacter sp. HJB301]MDD7971184.1 FCD domain-containing protein [Roseinatronobacter sp. HJB301]
MPFQRIQPEKLSKSVERQIELLLLRGILRPGERLPSERELAEKLGVSRPSLRDALGELQQRGLLTTRAGAGVYVEELLDSAFSDTLVQLFATHDEALFDYISFRRDLEGMSAERAARYGSDTDLQVIDTVFKKMEAAHQKRNPAEEAHLDAEFHLSIVEASHNIIMLHMMRAMFNLLHEGVFYNRQVIFRQRATRDDLLNQHKAINDALQARDPAGAKKAAEDHLNFVEQIMSDMKRSQKNEEIARLRFEHAQAK